MRVVLITALLSFAAVSFAGAAPIRLGSVKQLFLDDSLIESTSNIQRRIQQAQKYAGNPVLVADQPWEKGLVTLYGSVIKDGNKYRMWYLAGYSIAYAESKDGIHWTKPQLDIIQSGGKKTNLLFDQGRPVSPYYIELFGVIKDDRGPDPSARYKMGFLNIDPKYKGPDGDPFHGGQRRGLGVAGSPDGIHWKIVNDWATEAICDGLSTWMLDPARGKYVLYGRTKYTAPEVEAAWSKYDWYGGWHWGRSVARAESSDFIHWDHSLPASAPMVLSADAEDEPGTEIYAVQVFPYAGMYIGLVMVYLARPDASWIDLQLAASRDGVHFTRVGDRKPFIPLGQTGSWDRFIHSPSVNPPIEVGDELRFYYGGRTLRHAPYEGPDKGTDTGSIGFASVKRDRFAALQASFDGGEIVTKPLILDGKTLHLNAKSDFGEVVVEILRDGKLISQSRPVKRDALDIPVEWESGQVPADGQPVRLRIGLRNACLFAVWAE